MSKEVSMAETILITELINNLAKPYVQYCPTEIMLEILLVVPGTKLMMYRMKEPEWNTEEDEELAM